MTRPNEIGTVQHIVDQETYQHLSQERYRSLDRLVKSRTRLQDDILPIPGKPARRAVRDYITAEQELRDTEFRFMCVKVDRAEAGTEQGTCNGPQ
jgi:hypothetical protein